MQGNELFMRYTSMLKCTWKIIKIYCLRWQHIIKTPEFCVCHNSCRYLLSPNGSGHRVKIDVFNFCSTSNFLSLCCTAWAGQTKKWTRRSFSPRPSSLLPTDVWSTQWKKCTSYAMIIGKKNFWILKQSVKRCEDEGGGVEGKQVWTGPGRCTGSPWGWGGAPMWVGKLVVWILKWTCFKSSMCAHMGTILSRQTPLKTLPSRIFLAGGKY